MELKVGDYVRQKRGHIYRIKNKGELEAQQYRNEANDKENEGFIAIKSSPDIIDLIEVGDYVNGYKVLYAGATTWDNDGNVIDKRVHIFHDGYDRWLSENYIKSIVTKEQFESMEYKIGE